MKCLDYALSYLSRFPKTEQELKIQLHIKGYPSSEIQEAIAFCKQKKYIDDDAFVRSYLHSEVVKKGKPLIRVINKLKQKWISETLLRTHIEHMQEELHQGIYQAIQKDINTYKKKGLEGFDIIQKLMRKWYKLQDIKQVLYSSKWS